MNTHPTYCNVHSERYNLLIYCGKRLDEDFSFTIHWKYLDVSSLFDVFRPPRLRAEQFVPGNQEHVAILKSMGITMIQTKDGRIQLMQTASAVRFME